MRKSIIAILMTFCLSIMTYAQTPRDRATELKEQAQSSLNQKDYIKARLSGGIFSNKTELQPTER